VNSAAGYAEMMKFGLLAMPRSSPGWSPIGRILFAGAPPRTCHCSVLRGKAGVVSRDERETGERALLNLGHTFGHAFEAGAGYSQRLLHGEAVALGCVLAFEFSARKGLIGRGGCGARARSS